MVLNETSTSAWGWKQNSLIKVNRQTGEITYNHDFASIAILSQFIRAGDQLLALDIPKRQRAIAVKNQDRLVVLLQNKSAKTQSQRIALSSQAQIVELPAESISAFIFKTIH